MLDLVIKGGRVVDGTGSPWFHGDVGVEGDRIAALGRLDGVAARRTIQAEGRLVTPGIIDAHTHSDLTLAIEPRASSAVAQGVTTQIAGNCGVSAAPTIDGKPYYGPLDPTLTEGLGCDWTGFAGYFGRLERQGIATNLASFVGHGNIRAASMGYEDRAPTAPEMARMEVLTEEAMQDGAIGMTTGLAYIPGSYAKAEEIVRLARIVAKHGGLYASHIRNQTEGIAASVRECLEVGRQAGLPAHVSHMQPGAPRLGCAHELLAMIDGERRGGLDASCDAIPYTIGSTTLKSLLPPWACDGGDAAMIRRLKDPAIRRRIVDDTNTHGAESGGSRKRTLCKNGDWHKIWLASASRNANLVGQDFRVIATARGQDPYDALFDIIVEEEGKPWMLAEDVSEEDFLDIARHPVGGVVSDGFSLHPEGPLARGRHHPRSYGAFARFLRRFVREEAKLAWEQAIHKLTGYAASRFRLSGRGVLTSGAFADICVLDPDKVGETNDFGDPYRFAKGIDWVVCNGQVALEKGAATGALPGRVLRFRQGSA
jgi:N-acyl-D-aspartate/D-glutamate deacylase